MTTLYLDNAATSFPKPVEVRDAVVRTLCEVGGNPGRGGHHLAVEAGRLIFSAREAVAEFFNIGDASRVVFTSGATESLNLALFGLLQPGDRVVTTTMEHNAVVRPLCALRERGVTVVKVAADAEGLVDPAALAAACNEPTALVVVGHCSNVTGTIQPLAAIAARCHAAGIPLLVDAAQSAGLLPLDVAALGLDLLAVPGHKGLLGPAGTGFLYIRPGLQLRPLHYGGTGSSSHSEFPPTELPERFESGTPNVPGLAGLAAGITVLRARGLDAVRRHELVLLTRLRQGLAGLPGVSLYGPADPSGLGGVLSFNLAGVDPSEIGFRLDREFGICVRVGLHCAPDAHRTIGTFPGGTVRVSPGFQTTAAEIETFLTAIATIAASRS